MNKTIAWEQWYSTFLEDEIIDENNKNQEEYSDGYEDTQQKMLLVRNEQPNFITTNLGQVPILSPEKIQEQYNLWYGHTNFDITQEVKNKIEAVPGVEILRLLSRYRFLIGIAKNPCFTTVEVKNQIVLALCDGKNPVVSDVSNTKEQLISPLEKQIKENIHKITEEKINKKYSKWFIFVFPNGEIMDYHTNNETDVEYNRHLEIAKTLSEKINGVLIQESTVKNE